MACDDLDSSMVQNRPGGSLASSGRPSGSLADIARGASGGLCRSFSFAPPVVIPAGQIITFNDDPMISFAGELLYSF